MDNKGKLIYACKYSAEEEMKKAFATDLDDDENCVDDTDLDIDALLENQEELKPDPKKIREKDAFVEKAKQLAARARLDVEIKDSNDSIVVTYQIGAAFLSPGAQKLLGEVILMGDDMVIMPPAQGESTIMITLAYHLYE